MPGQELQSWQSGWNTFKQSHTDMSDCELLKWQDYYYDKFDVNKFIDHYNRLSDKEWLEVIRDAKSQGYDIRAVLYYKKECEKSNPFNRLFHVTFDVSSYPEIMYVLECMDGCIDFRAYNHEECLDEYEKEKQREIVVNTYSRFHLPVPEYWKMRLW